MATRLKAGDVAPRTERKTGAGGGPRPGLPLPQRGEYHGGEVWFHPRPRGSLP